MMTKIKTFFVTYGWTICALIVSSATLLCWFASLGDGDYFFNSDALYLPSLYRDIFQDGYTLNGWTLNPAPNIFPDMLLFFPLNAIFGDFITAIFGFAFIQYFAYIFILYLIFKNLKPNLHPSTFVPAIFLFSSYLFIDNAGFQSALLNLNSYHNGAFIMGLLCVYLFIKYFNTKSQKILIVVLILSMLSGACDKLFFIYFSIPVSLVIIVLYFFNKDWKTLTRFLVTIALGTILAIVLWRFFMNNSYFSLSEAYGNITLWYIEHSWSVFSQQMYGYLTSHSFAIVLTYFSLFSYVVVVIYVFRKTLKLIREKKHADVLFAFQLFVLFFVPIVLFAPILSGSYDNPYSLRYNYFPYILLPFNSVVLLGNWLNKNKLVRIILNTTLSLLMAGYLFFNFTVQELKSGLNHFFTFYPEKVRIIDDYFLDDNTLKYGITNDYWTAKQTTMFSKKGVRLYSAWNWGEPWLHVSNKYWFIDHDKGKHAHCEFTFLLWEKETEVPEIFKKMNDSLQAVELGNFYLYEVNPYRFIIPGSQFGIEPVLILDNMIRDERKSYELKYGNFN